MFLRVLKAWRGGDAVVVMAVAWAVVARIAAISGTRGRGPPTSEMEGSHRGSTWIAIDIIFEHCALL